jgi:hypothetical protein
VRLLYVFIIIFLISFQSAMAESASCAQKKENVIRVLLEGSGRIRSTMEKIQRNETLSAEEREDFRTKADWLVAWTKDQAEILASKNDCESLDNLISATRIEWKPVVLSYRKLQAKILMSHLSRIEFATADNPKELLNAKSILENIQTEDDLYKSKIALRKAIFLLRTGLRKIR